MAVIAHHPVVIHLKGIAVGLFTIDQNILAIYSYFVAFVPFNCAAVKGQSRIIERNGPASFWHYDRTKIILVPFKFFVMRKNVSVILAGFLINRNNAFDI